MTPVQFENVAIDMQSGGQQNGLKLSGFETPTGSTAPSAIEHDLINQDQRKPGRVPTSVPKLRSTSPVRPSCST